MDHGPHGGQEVPLVMVGHGRRVRSVGVPAESVTDQSRLAHAAVGAGGEAAVLA
jgi:hypothetical protein